MPVVLLDPRRPDVIPIRAITLLAGPVLVTADISPSTIAQLGPTATVAESDDDPGTTLISGNPGHPLVRARIERGDEIIAAAPVSGAELLDAVALMDTLRRGGPWESTQTHASLRRYLLEEVYELLDAIELDDSDELRSELGDLLLQVLFHARIAADRAEGSFDIDDVARSFVTKVTHRTPGVLSGAHADLETQIREWEERKAAERHRGSVLDGIATGARALAIAQKVLERLAGAGFPMSVIDPKITTVAVEPGGDSVEEVLRQRVRALMQTVTDAEQAATVDGVELRSESDWLRYLGAISDADHDSNRC